ncbi:MAG: peptide deformylase [Alphaproteobacteria bacterium]|nr:peptide deformylase [Alphaproteobacteria bacterium]
MAILKIARMGHPVLQRVADPVPDPTAPEISRLVQDMIETMVDAEGLGLAAPQVHVPLRLVIFHVPPARADDDHDEMPLSVLINPEIEPLAAASGSGWEGCLSVPGLRGRVSRFAQIRYRGVDLKGEPIDRVAEGMHARVVQHECDHLDGVLYPMRMTDLRDLVFESEWKHIAGPGTEEAGDDLLD